MDIEDMNIEIFEPEGSVQEASGKKRIVLECMADNVLDIRSKLD